LSLLPLRLAPFPLATGLDGNEPEENGGPEGDQKARIG